MKRIEWIDSLKGFGIFCVTVGHQTCHYLIETHIYSFHMFLFFFISGFLHNNAKGDFKQYITKKTNALFIPFLIWNILSCFAGVVCLGENVVESIRLFFLLDGKICWNAPIWFLLQLYIVEIVYFFLEKYVRNRIYLCVPILVIFWALISENNILLKLNILPVCLLYYVLGHIFKQFYNKWNNRIIKTHKYIFSIAILLLFVNILFGVLLNNRISFTGADFGNVIYCSLAAISGVLFYIIVFQNVPFLRTNKVLSYLGKNSMIIMASQYWFFMLYDVISMKLFNMSVWHYRNTLKALVISIITISLICLIIEMVKKIGDRNIGVKKICTWFGVNML